MSELTVFLAAYIGSLCGMLTAVLPIMYVVKKKLENSPMGAMFG
jgi:hypothetical protein